MQNAITTLECILTKEISRERESCERGRGGGDLGEAA